MLRIYSKKGFRIWSILLIFCILLSIFACTVQEASANPIAIPIAAGVLVGSFLIASGLVFSNQQSFESAITDVWGFLSTGVKNEIERASILYGTAVSLGEYAYNQLSQAAYNLVDPSVLHSVLTSGTEQAYLVSDLTMQVGSMLAESNPNYYLANMGFIGNIRSGPSYSFSQDSAMIRFERTSYDPDATYGLSYMIPYYSGNMNYESMKTAILSVVYHHTEGSYVFYEVTLKNSGSLVLSSIFRSTQYNVAAVPTSNYSVDPDTLLGGVVNQAISNGIVDGLDVASNVGTNSIGADTPIVVPPLDWGLADLINKQQQDILDLQQQIDVLTNLSTGEMTSEGELVGDGTGTGIFEGIGKWILNIPILGSILQLLLNILEAIQDITAVSDFTLDFSPLKIGLTEVFPFCIPFDLLRMVTVYSATPDDFVLSIDLETDYFVIDHDVDLSPFSIPIIFFRWVVTIWFSWILISRTRDMIKW